MASQQKRSCSLERTDSIRCVVDIGTLYQDVPRRRASFRRLAIESIYRCQRLREKCVEQAAAGIGGGGEACFQPVAQHHQFIYLGDNAVLFGERRERDW